MSHVSHKLGQFTYFDTQLGHPSWQGKYVLDFGGNNGNILKTTNPVIDHEKYWCIDVSPDGIARGKRDFPNANWILYDRYNINFNPTGSPLADIPVLEQRFDFILAYSVFTHVDVAEMDHLTERLLALLKPGGAFAFTFIDHRFHSWPDEYPGNNLKWRLDRMNIGPSAARAMLDRVEVVPWFGLFENAEIFIEDQPIPEPERYAGLGYHVFHTVDFMRAHFPGAEILPPANYEMQHCCILREGARRPLAERTAAGEEGLSASRA